jgi:hypothetical protein
MTTEQTTWPEEMTWNPIDAELETERRYWQMMDRMAELDAWTEMQAELDADDVEDLEEVA